MLREPDLLHETQQYIASMFMCVIDATICICYTNFMTRLRTFDERRTVTEGELVQRIGRVLAERGLGAITSLL